MTDIELANLLRPHVQRMVTALRAQSSDENPYATGVQSFSAGSSDLTFEDAARYADYFGADDDGSFPGHLHAYFACTPKQFADRTGLVKKQVVDKNNNRVWRWVKRQVSGATPSQPAPTAPVQPAPAHVPAVPDPKPKQPGRFARTKTAAVAKLSKTRGGRAALSLGGGAVKVFHAIEHKAMFAAKKVQQVAATAVQERGFPPERAEKLKHALYAADFLGGYVTGAAAVAAGAPMPVVKGVMFMPSASVAYLAYSTALNPRATLRAAKKVLKDTFAKPNPNAPATHAAGDAKDFDADGLAIADALKSAADPDLWVAVFCLALGQTQGDTHAALDLTNRALASQASSTDDEGDTGFTEDGEQWFSEAAYAQMSEIDRSHLVLREVPSKKGGTVKRWIRIGAKPNAPEAKPNKDPNAHGAAQAVLKDPGQLTPNDFEMLPGVFKSLNKDQLRDLAHAHGLSNGGTKQVLCDRLLDLLKAKAPKEPTAPITGTAGGKPSNQVDAQGKPTPHFEQQNPHANSESLNDPLASGEPNQYLPDACRPATPDLKTAKYVNNYTWGYDQEMNAALRDTDAPPQGYYGGSPLTSGLPPELSDMIADLEKIGVKGLKERIAALPPDQKAMLDKKFNPAGPSPAELAAAINGKLAGRSTKPHKSGPEMFSAIRGQFAKAPTFGPPPITVKRGIDVDQETQAALLKEALTAQQSGGVIEIKGFVSTGTGAGFPGNVTYTIEAIHGLDVKPYSHFPSESELLLNHGCRYKVISAARDPGGTKVHLHLQQITTGV